MFDTGAVFKRTGTNLLSERQYNLIIGATLFWGFIMNYLLIKYIPASVVSSINPIVFIISYFAVCFLGIWMFTSSDSPAISFAGYNLVVIPFGLVINMAVSKYSPTIVIQSMFITAAVTLSMIIAGTIFPKFFEKLGAVLLTSLIVVILVELSLIIITGKSANWMNWIVAILFSLYIGYDWHRASTVPRTLNNAIDIAAALYMDIINLFLRVLGINSNSNKNK